ncbi:unnamed protein product [Bemisia tabaci]|uniref:C2H2-type domain-containing protein n=1 Tax=Bemisia tabaci TaxID=7038 RepID=A0A9P0F9H0_BEMTA|nr:unnamed protein product [Bemisia tabaci]
MDHSQAKYTSTNRQAKTPEIAPSGTSREEPQNDITEVGYTQLLKHVVEESIETANDCSFENITPERVKNEAGTSANEGNPSIEQFRVRGSSSFDSLIGLSTSIKLEVGREDAILTHPLHSTIEIKNEDFLITVSAGKFARDERDPDKGDDNFASHHYIPMTSPIKKEMSDDPPLGQLQTLGEETGCLSNIPMTSPVKEEMTDDPPLGQLQALGEETAFLPNTCNGNKTDSPDNLGLVTIREKAKPNNKKFSCSSCSSSFSRKDTLTEHLRTHTGEKPFRCNHCSVSFAQKSTLMEHKRKHTGEKPYTCSHCSVSFAHKSSLTYHVRTHSYEEPFNCSHCSTPFAQKRHLRQHMLLHTGEKSFICSHCSASFARKNYLKVHLQTHADGKRFKCSLCPSSFSQKTTFNNHMRKHTGGEKPFGCSHCSSSYTTKSNLSKHMLRRHTDNEPLSCRLCELLQLRDHSVNCNLLGKHRVSCKFE